MEPQGFFNTSTTTAAPTLDEIVKAVGEMNPIQQNAIVAPSTAFLKDIPVAEWTKQGLWAFPDWFAGLPVYVIPTETALRVVPLDEAIRLLREWEDSRLRNATAIP